MGILGRPAETHVSPLLFLRRLIWRLSAYTVCALCIFALQASSGQRAEAASATTHPKACSASSLRVSALPLALALDHQGYLVEYTNLGWAPCALSRYPTVVALGSVGVRHMHHRAMLASNKPSGYLGPARSHSAIQPVILSKGGVAYSSVTATGGGDGNIPCGRGGPLPFIVHRFWIRAPGRDMPVKVFKVLMGVCRTQLIATPVIRSDRGFELSPR